MCGYNETVVIPIIIEDTETETTTEEVTEEVTTEITTEVTTEVDAQVPQTGDESDMFLYLVLSGLSLIGATLLVGYKRHIER